MESLPWVFVLLLWGLIPNYSKGLCRAERSLMSPVLGRNKLRETSHEQFIITSNCQLYCQFSLVNLCGRESLCNIIGEIAVIILLANGTLSAMPNEFFKHKGP